MSAESQKARPAEATDSSARGRPLIIGHRGARGLAPENTLAAFHKAVEIGVDAVEFDVQRTADGHLVIFHDDALKRLTGADGLLVKSTLAELRQLDAGSHFGSQFAGERIPTLEEVIEALPARILLHIEAKRFTVRSDGLEQDLVEAIRRHHLYGRCVVSSFNPLILWRISRMDRRIPLGLLYRPDLALPLRRAWSRYFLRLASLNPFHGFVTPALMAHARRRGWQVYTWTVNEPAEMCRLIALGVDGIITDRPDVLKEVVYGREDR